MKPIVEYRTSTHASRFGGYQSKHGNAGTLTLYLPTLWAYARGRFEEFVAEVVYTTLVERICLERAFQKIRLRNRCSPCKIEQVLLMMRDAAGDWAFLTEEAK